MAAWAAAWKEIPVGAIFRLFDSIKTRVLGFAIDLEREAPDAGDPYRQPSRQPRETESVLHQQYRRPSRQPIKRSSSFSQVANLSIQSGDWASLDGYLQSLGLSASDLQGLQADLDEARHSGKSAKEALEGTPRGWIDRLTAKATEGAPGVAIEVAATGIAKAIAASSACQEHDLILLVFSGSTPRFPSPAPVQAPDSRCSHRATAHVLHPLVGTREGGALARLSF